MQEGMGYGMYAMVLPFVAWMIVLVVSMTLMFCTHLAPTEALGKTAADVVWPEQAVYADAYVVAKNNLAPATGAITMNQLNL